MPEANIYLLKWADVFKQGELFWTWHLKYWGDYPEVCGVQTSLWYSVIPSLSRFQSERRNTDHRRSVATQCPQTAEEDQDTRWELSFWWKRPAETIMLGKNHVASKLSESVEMNLGTSKDRGLGVGCPSMADDKKTSCPILLFSPLHLWHHL